MTKPTRDVGRGRAVGVLVVLLAIAVLIAMVSRRVLRSVIDSGSEALIIAVVLVAISAVLIGIAGVRLFRRQRGEHVPLSTRVMLTIGCAILLFGVFGAGRSRRSSEEARRIRREELHNFPLFFWVSLGVAFAVGFAVIVVVSRRREANAAHQVGDGGT